MRVVDSSLWVDYFRLQTPAIVKQQVDAIARDPEIVLTEPILFEMLRAAPVSQRTRLREYFATIPILATPPNLWSAATLLGQRCHERGFLPPALDLLIAQVCLHHQATLVTFDDHFQPMTAVAPLKLQLLQRATA